MAPVLLALAEDWRQRIHSVLEDQRARGLEGRQSAACSPNHRVDSIITHEQARTFEIAKGSQAYNVQYVFKPSSLVCFEHPFDWPGAIHSLPAA